MEQISINNTIEGNYHVVFFKKDSGGTSLQSRMANQFLTNENFYGEVNLVPGVKIKIPYSHDWYTVTDVFVSEKIKTVFVACEYVFEDDLDV